MKQTAVEWLHEEYMRILKDNNISVLQAFEILDKYNQAKDIEKEQIIIARQDGLDNGFSNGSWDSNLYYHETYKINKL
jgi:hypothetical protein